MSAVGTCSTEGLHTQPGRRKRSIWPFVHRYQGALKGPPTQLLTHLPVLQNSHRAVSGLVARKADDVPDRIGLGVHSAVSDPIHQDTNGCEGHVG